MFILKFKRIYMIFKRTGAIKIFFGFVLFILLSSFLLLLFEDNVKTYGDALWYCFISSTTIGFGDIYAVTTIGRIITVVLSIYGIIVTAMMTGVIVSYYNEYLEIKKSETISKFLDKLEALPNLSKKELEDLSGKIKEFNRN
ncbi:MAG: two pore domain potassium channel family protein [Bacilli bacterium]|nr:two pore domain potassium channel family protein [Bacilli bacterium]